MNKQVKRAPIIGVIGSGVPGPHDRQAHKLGELLAVNGYILLTGGGNGVMRAASEGAAKAGGLVVAILPSDGPNDARFAGTFPNPFVHIPIFTGLSEARNAINVKSSDVVVTLPGGAGTLSEIALALKANKPVLVLGWPEFVLPPSCPQELIHHIHNVSSALPVIRELLS